MFHKREKTNYISKNIDYLVKREKMKEDAFGKRFGLKRGTIRSYINAESEPDIKTLQRLCERYNLFLDSLVNTDLERKAAGNTAYRDRHRELLSRYSINEIAECMVNNEQEFKRDHLFDTYLETITALRMAKHARQQRDINTKQIQFRREESTGETSPQLTP